MPQRISFLSLLLLLIQAVGLVASSLPSFVLIPTISGPSSVCTGSGNYIYATESGMSGYTWGIASGGSIVSGSGTNAITVQWTAVGVHTISVTYTTATSPGVLDVTASEPVVPIVTIEASVNPVCSGSLVTFTATPANEGISPIYQWKVNGIIVGPNSPIYAYTPANGDEIEASMTSSANCANPSTVISNMVTMTVSQNLPVSLSIAASANPVCMGTVVTFTAIPVNGGTAPIFSWFVNGSPIGNSSPTFAYSPSDNDVVKCILTSSFGCASGNPATSNLITMNVPPVLPVSATVSASANPVCSGNSVTFTVTVANAGPSPSYQWKVNGNNMGSSNPVLIYIPENNDVITCNVTSSSTCTMGQTSVSDPFTMTVNPLQPVSLLLSASSNPSCLGALVTFTATPSNGGTAPAYQWTVNGFNSGTNSGIFQYIPANEDSVACQVTSNIQCPSGNPATSPPIIMETSPLLPVTVSISPSSNPVCQGASVTFTAADINGGNSPSYQWRVNGLPTGSNQNTFTYVPANNDDVSCILTSSEPCATGTATSNTVTMTLSPVVLPIVTISASENPTCAGTIVTYLAVPTYGGSSPQYQWYINGLPAGLNISLMTYVPSDGDEVFCSMTSSRNCVSANPVLSDTLLMTVSPALPVGITVSASENPVCMGESVTLTATEQNGGSGPAFQWMVNNIEVGSNVPQYTYAPANGDQVTCVLTSSLSCATGNPVQSDPLTIAVTPLVPVSLSIAASENPSCQGTEIVYTATPVNGGLSPSYQWHANGIDVGTNSPVFSNSPTNGLVITCTVTSNAACILNSQAISNPITMVVNPTFMVGVTITASDNPVCQGQTVTFSANELNGGPSPFYQWFVNNVATGSNSPVYAYIPSDGDVVKCQLASSLTCTLGNPVLSNEITLSVNTGFPVSVSVTPSANPVCQGEQVIFAATTINGGNNPIYQWLINGSPLGVTNDTLIFTPVNGNVITCEVTSSQQCATSNPATSLPVTMSVDPVSPVVITIIPSENPVCEGGEVLFTSTIFNGGSSPTFQWKVNGVNAGSNQNTFSYIPVEGDEVTCNLTSNVACPSSSPASSNIVVMETATNLSASILIDPSANPFCSGDEITVTATAVNGGSSPAYQWQLNGSNTGSNQSTYSFTFSDGDQVSCILTSSATCVTGNPFYSNTLVLATTASLPVDITIDASANPSCEGTFVTFTADPENGGETPNFQWQVNGVNAGTNNRSFMYMPMDSDIVTCILTSSFSCAAPNPATSNSITMEVTTGEPVAVTIAANPAGTVCAGTDVTFSATVTNGGTTPIYQWSVNGTPSGSSLSTFSYTPANGDIVLCSVTSSQSCALFNPALSNPVTMSVIPFSTVGVSIAASANPVCTGTWVDFTATPVNGGITPAYQWAVNSIPVGTNINTYYYQPQDGDQVTCTLTSSISCSSNNPATSSAITMYVHDELPVIVTIVPLLNPICAGSLIQYTATPVNQGNTPHYQWKVNGVNVGNNNYIYQYFPANGDDVSCVLTSSLACASGNPATSNTITMVAFPSAPVSISLTTPSTDLCQNDTVTITATAINGGSSPTFLWKKNGAAVGTNDSVYSFVPVDGDVVYCMLLSNAQCKTGSPATSTQLSFTVYQPQTVIVSITASTTTLCEGAQAVFTATTVNGGPTPHYQWYVNGVDSGTDSPTFVYNPTHGDVVKCNVISSVPCPVSNPVFSNSIVLTVSPILPVSVGILSSTNPSCTGIPVVFTANPMNGGVNPQYQWSVNRIPSGTSSNTFVYPPDDQDTISCELTSSAGCIFNNPALSNSIIQSVSNNFPVDISIAASMNPVCLGQSVVYSATAINPGMSPVYQWTVNGINVGLNYTTLTHVPSNNDIVQCEVTSSYSCATNNPASSNQILMEAGSALPASIQITASANPTCQGSLVSFSGASVYGGTNPQFSWSVNGIPVGSNLPDYSYIPEAGDQISCTMTSSYACAANNPVVSNIISMLVVAPQPCSVTVSPLSNPICEGDPVTVESNVLNGGTNPTFMWKVNGIPAGSNQPFLTYIPIDNDEVWCRIISKNVCTYGDTIPSDTASIGVSSGLPVSIAISTPNNPTCQGTSATFTSTVVNGGSNPTYQWSVNGVNVGANSDSYTYIPTNGDSIQCTLTSSITCAISPTVNSNTLIITANPLLAVDVTIAPSANPVCQNESVTFTAYPINGGSSPQYTWIVNGNPVPGPLPSYTYIPADGETVRCLLSSSETCLISNPDTSNAVVMIVSSTPVQVGLTISASANPFCAGDSVTFIPDPVNGGNLPQYTWYLNQVPVGNGDQYTLLPNNEDSVFCRLLSNAACALGNPASSNTVVLHENPLVAASVTLAVLPPNPVCAGTTVYYSASPLNGGTNPGYQWYVNSTPLGTNSPQFSYIPADGDTVFIAMTTTVECPVANPVISLPEVAVVNPNLPVSVTVSHTPVEPVCEGVTVTYTAVHTNGGSNPQYQWEVNGIPAGNGTSSFSAPSFPGDQTACMLISSETCTTNNPATSNNVSSNTFPPTYVSFTHCSNITSRDAKPILLRGGVPSGGEYRGDAVVNGIFNPSSLPASQDSASLWYRYTDMNSCVDSASQIIRIEPSPNFTCGDLFTDIRDQQNYETIEIVSQCWFRENLNYGSMIQSDATAGDNCVVEKFCYTNIAGNCSQNGGLYQWQEMMDYQPIESSQGICPPGWHIPTEGEWMTLFSYFSGLAYAGRELKTGGSSGFNALLSGSNFQQQSWSFQGFSGFFWSSTSLGSYRSISHALNILNDGVSTSHALHSNAFSVRCIRD